jgi:glycosyltransferase involved in cell wall biosynthesis
MAPEKAPDLAIEVALAAGRDLLLAGPTEDVHREYFDTRVRPGLASAGVEYAGPLARGELVEVLGDSQATLFPLRWDEPFGLVAVESLAAGTPVIGWRRGALPELIEPGVTGALVSSVDDAVTAVGSIAGLDRRACRAEAERRFSRQAMAAGYVAAYRSVLDR